MKSKIYQPHRPGFCFTALCAGIILFISSATGTAKPDKSPLMPPNANFRGMSFEDWNVLAVEIDVASSWGGELDLPDTFKRTLLLRNGLWLPENEYDVQISPGTALVLPAFFIVSERYDLLVPDPDDPDGPPIPYEDDPNYIPDPDHPDETIIDYFFENTVVELKLDGEVILSGTAAELMEYQFGVTYFEEPVFYEVPQDRGFANAVASVNTFGVGAVFHPLPPGEYIIESSYEIVAPPFIPYSPANFTFNVTVSR